MEHGRVRKSLNAIKVARRRCNSSEKHVTDTIEKRAGLKVLRE